MKKIKFLAVAAIAAVSMMCGCGSTSSKLDSVLYTEYVKGVMDCSYKGDLESYKKVCDATTEEATTVHESTIEYYAAELMYYNGVAYDYISDELKDKYIELARQLMAKCKYTVNTATKVDGSYQVKIDIEPLDFNDLATASVQAYMDEYNKMIENVDFSAISDEEANAYEETYGLNVYNILASYVEQTGYKTVRSKIVIIENHEDNTYGINDEDWYDIDDYVVDMD